MPPQRKTGNKDFKFDVAAPPGWTFAPGDVIIGNLVRHAHIVTPEATVTLSLIGRVKTRFVQETSSSDREYSDEWHLFERLPEVIFRGPLHLPEESTESLSWPFSIQIPLKPRRSVMKGHAQAASFLPLNWDHPAHHTLPGTFCWLGGASSGSADSECFVEYYLSAQLRYKFGSFKNYTATWPITLRHSVDNAGQPDQVIQLSATQKVRSQRLLPGLKNTDLSVKQKTLKFFGSSKVPEFHFRVNLTTPRIIQLSLSQAFPLVLEVLPLDDKISNSIKEVPQDIQTNGIKVFLISRTSLRAGDPWDRATRNNQHSSSSSLRLESVFQKAQRPLRLSPSEGNSAIDLGQAFQLGLGSHGLTSCGLSLGYISMIYPDFVTYNIKHSHMLHWKISLTIAGETQVIAVNGPLKIIGMA
ncbi:uncharacterized protein N7482_010611 [Penicillium canariense]|uniref:Arrestin-like N-terminal domain-containing protein n=1 Tax=Penicillium canariense TaxID=189055 RepID=A0A9W9LE82_9EURO|nr:uncharacterized protein N7482_010611 [Penicillium canariense]KAJ5151359.1 hypothetical protein N7482_010611 [Penicillium canariense]